ncbi:hypothetical protein F4811DRAFT_558022 [Daldinia bambusicola]|nr:hypothetical protein F4811DRAFT_558022 [Daldinia bambusicola]
MYLPRPQFPHSRQLQLPLLVEKETEEPTGDSDDDWLDLAKESIRGDLEASKKELELVRDLLSELDGVVDIRKADRGARDRLFLMRACQEYSGSRSCMLEERLRQIDVWADEARLGRSVPSRVPDEWIMVDIEWRQWLSEQVAPRDSASNQANAMSCQRDAVQSWGPLIPILAALIE